MRDLTVWTFRMHPSHEELALLEMLQSVLREVRHVEDMMQAGQLGWTCLCPDLVNPAFVYS